VGQYTGDMIGDSGEVGEGFGLSIGVSRHGGDGQGYLKCNGGFEIRILNVARSGMGEG